MLKRCCSFERWNKLQNFPPIAVCTYSYMLHYVLVVKNASIAEKVSSFLSFFSFFSGSSVLV